MHLPSLVMTDIDGVWTDGGMYYDSCGNESKKFNTSDSAGVIFLRNLKIPVAIITGEDTPMVKARATKLNISLVFQGVQDKVAIAESLCDRLNVTLRQAAYIGDDLTDLRLLRVVGTSGCPANAPNYVKQLVQIVTKRQGGEGAFREFVEEILTRSGHLENVVQRFL